MDRGYLKLWRKSTDAEVFACPHLWRLWCWCLFRANYKSRVVAIKTGKGSILVNLGQGEFVFGRDSAAMALQESPSTVRNRMSKLESMGMITIRPANQYSTISICNWALYQEEDVGKGQQQDNQRTTEGQLKDTDKNDKKEKNMKKSLGTSKAPTDFLITEEMRSWVVSNTSFSGNIDFETDKFLDHFRSSGERKKDWLATWRNWMRRAGEYNFSKQASNGSSNAGPGKRIVI